MWISNLSKAFCSRVSRLYINRKDILRRFHTDLSPVKPGKLIVNTVNSVKIWPAKTNSDLTSCKAEVKLHSATMHPEQLLEQMKKVEIEVQEKDQDTVLCVNSSQAIDGELHVRIPYHYSVLLNNAVNSSTQISSLEADSIRLNLNDGNCELIKVKAMECCINGRDTNLVLAKSFIGNIECRINNGSLIGDKLQGQNITLSTVSGNINIGSLYATKSHLSCGHGDISVDNCHGCTFASVTLGDITMKSVEGEVTANAADGNVNVHLTDCKLTDIQCGDGEANISLPESIYSSITLQTHQLVTDDSLILDITERDSSSNIKGTIGESTIVGSPAKSINIRASTVKLHVMDWITAQKLSYTSEI